ncbi:S-adenosyl-L-methionine-dependent methyltransferase [Aspergillus venezuelensis]
MASYTTNHAPTVLHTHSWRTAQNSAPHLLPHIKPTSRILDIGCGPGSITVDFASLASSGHGTGIEYSADPLEEARALADARGVKNVTFQVGDIHSLDFEDDTFDIVHVHQVLQHISDPVKALSEMRRVVKKGGIVAARESDSFSWYPANKGLELWLSLTTTIASAKGGNPHPGKKMHVWAKEAGFEMGNIQRSTGSWCFSSPEEREYWGEGMARRMEDSGLAEQCLDGGFANKQELEGIAKGWREWVRDEEGWFAVLHGQMLCWK